MKYSVSPWLTHISHKYIMLHTESTSIKFTRFHNKEMEQSISNQKYETDVRLIKIQNKITDQS